ncbi:MAG TPA: response regulator [Polyangiaceae bacterium]|jgi:DNA-binding NtrC family response regulator
MLEVLVADDDENVREAVASAIVSAGHRVTEATDGAEAVELMASQVFDLAICDVQMPRLGGMALLRRIRRDAPGTAVVIMSAFGEIPDAVSSLRDGAVEFVTKPFDPDEFARQIVEPIAVQRGLRKAFERAKAAQAARATGTTLVAVSPVMRAVAERIQVLANTDASGLISGDRGTGKELVARAIHAQGPRREGPLVIADGTILRELLSERRDADDLPDVAEECFREAMGGTLVLDGIERLSLRAQVRLLRVIDGPGAAARRSPWWTPLGVRLLTLTRENPTGRAGSGELLESLYYRLSAVHLHVPALHERSADFCDLVVELLDELLPPGITRPGVTAEAWRLLSSYPFPGNVRELRWALEHALALAEGGPIDAEHLPPEVAACSTEGA